MATIKVSRTTSCSRAINYAEPRATIKTGINCDVDYAKSEMKQIRMLYGKDDRVQAHLLIQSFRPGEITAEKANQLGAEYAKKIAPDHQIAIYTHTDKDHIHNHIVINSVNLETGKKFQAHGQAFLNKCYDLNDEICLAHNLPITERGKKPEKRTMSEIKLKEKNAIIFGNEGNGISDDFINITNYKTIIPILSNTESLNVAVATGIILYKFREIEGAF